MHVETWRWVSAWFQSLEEYSTLSRGYRTLPNVCNRMLCKSGCRRADLIVGIEGKADRRDQSSSDLSAWYSCHISNSTWS
jgi:hypothetical protein